MKFPAVTKNNPQLKQGDHGEADEMEFVLVSSIGEVDDWAIHDTWKMLSPSWFYPWYSLGLLFTGFFLS